MIEVENKDIASAMKEALPQTFQSLTLTKFTQIDGLLGLINKDVPLDTVMDPSTNKKSPIVPFKSNYAAILDDSQPTARRAPTTRSSSYRPLWMSNFKP